MPTGLGSRAAAALAFETTYGTPPASGFRAISFARKDFGARQDLIAPELLGEGRDPSPPMQGLIDVDHSAEVPVDLRQIGNWLRLAFGGVTATENDGVFTHVFTSGGYTLPSVSLQVGNPDVPSFTMVSGLMLNEIGWNLRRANENLTAAVSLIGQSEALGTTTGAGTPSTTAPLRAGHFHGAITRNGAALGGVTEGRFRYSNNLERSQAINPGGVIAGIDVGVASLTGSLSVRFENHTLLNQAIAGEPCELAFTWSRGANASLSVVAHAVYLPRPRRQIQGQGAILAEFDWQAARAAAPARLCTVTLINDVEAY